MRYIAELERKVQTLQTEATTLSAQLTLLQVYISCPHCPAIVCVLFSFYLCCFLLLETSCLIVVEVMEAHKRLV